MSLNYGISCVVGIYIFSFNTYWKRFFNFMEIKTTTTFKQFFQSKTLNSKKNHTINDMMWKDWEPYTSRQWKNNKFTITYLQGEVWWTIVQGYSFKQVSSTRKKKKHSPWKIYQGNQRTWKTVRVGILRALTHHLEETPYRNFLPERKKRPWIWVFLNKRRRRQKKIN